MILDILVSQVVSVNISYIVVGGRGLLDYYNNSLFLILRSVFPEYKLNAFLFEKVPRNFWNDGIFNYINFRF